jgi:hypothetical protein
VQEAVREQGFPLIGDENSIDAFQCQVQPLVAPCEWSAIDMTFFEHCFIEEAAELPQEPTAQPIIVFYLLLGRSY